MDNPTGNQYATRVHQACGIVAERKGETVDEAAVLIAARAAATGMSVDQVAAAVIDGRIRFDE